MKGFGCRRVASGRPGKEPASESLRRRNPRESDEGGLAVYGVLAWQELWQEMVFAGSLRLKAADDGGLTAAAVLDGRIDDWSVMSCRCLQALG